MVRHRNALGELPLLWIAQATARLSPRLPQKGVGPTMLKIAWQVNKAHSPLPWCQGVASRTAKNLEYMIQIKPKDIAYHTAIVAQSGSGKSFFLGRLLEEILLATKSRCIILDPNSDFSTFNLPTNKWRDFNRYDATTDSGFLTQEDRFGEFSKAWRRISMEIQSSNTHSRSKIIKPIDVAIENMSADFLLQDLNAIDRSTLFHVHGFVKSYIYLLNLENPKSIDRKIDFDPINEMKNQLNTLSRDELQTQLDTRFAKNLSVATASPQAVRSLAFEMYGIKLKKTGWFSGFVRQFLAAQVVGKTRHSINTIIESSVFLRESNDVWGFYCGEIQKYQSQGAVSRRATGAQNPMARVQIINLPSVESVEARMLIVDTLIQKEWNAARGRWEAAMGLPKNQKDTRVPTFIVVDEAHNLMPSQPRRPEERILRDRFRTLAAEGRKLGLFLVLVSQRPDKLDPMVVSECENRAVMKLAGQTVLQRTIQSLGWEDIPQKQMQECLEFQKGRVLLYGPWTGFRAIFGYGATRRTVEGGKNLDEEVWAKPLPNVGLSRGERSSKKALTTT
jgi:type II secretory pathway predicted ATPase ExeA